MTDKKLTDKEIKKALECCVTSEYCADCPCIEKQLLCPTSDIVLDYINRLEAENEHLKNQVSDCRQTVKCENIDIAHIKDEAYKEFYKKLHTEILEARDSNFKAKEERVAKSKKFDIPIDVEDNFLMYCDGKIHALDGIDYFAYEIVKEMESEGTCIRD